MMAMFGGQEADRARRARARTRAAAATTMSSTSFSGNSDTSAQNSSLIPGTEVVVPGTFVVFQGNSGDGLSNTIQSLPTVPLTGSSAATTSSSLANTIATSVLNPLPEHEYETVETPGGLPLGQLATAPMTTAAARLVTSAVAASSSSTPISSTSTVDSSDDFVDPMSTSGMSSSHSRSSGTDEFIVVGEGSISPSRQSSNDTSPSDPTVSTAAANGQRDSESLDLDEASIRQWERTCREVEIQQRKEWIDSLRHVPPHLLDHCMMATSSLSTSSSSSTTSNTVDRNDTNNHEENEDESSYSTLWWQSHGKVAVLNDLPQKDPISGKVKRSVIAMLNPGSTVYATKVIHLDSSTLNRIEVPTRSLPSSSSDSADQETYIQGQKGWIQILELQIDPIVMTMKNTDTNMSVTTTGYAVLSLDGYPFLGPGSPSLYVDPNQWVWRVTCPVGAFVRDGVELTTRHIDTIPYGSMINVSKRCINNQGLSRLQAQQYVVDHSNSGSYRRVCGWISELLNPLSGQRGIVAQPLPFPVPALYKVTLNVGAVIRKGIELSSPQIGQAPHGAILKIVGRAFSETPFDRSIERLQLAGDGGWISVRLNRPPPRDELVVEFVEIDGSFDPKAPGRYHLTAQRAALEAARQRRAATRRAQNDRSSHDDISSINEDDLLYDHEEDELESPTRHSTPNLSEEPGSSMTADSLKCVVCLTSDRNACLVHGETGHIVCCLVCARILKARGDKCPVCRLPIASVIQHFYA